jgi:hypothetical protein
MVKFSAQRDKMKEIILTLVFSIVLLLVMFYPAIKIMEFVEQKKELSQKAYMLYTLLITALLSLIAGGLLSFM